MHEMRIACVPHSCPVQPYAAFAMPSAQQDWEGPLKVEDRM
jgi:hypothetical protein